MLYRDPHSSSLSDEQSSITIRKGALRQLRSFRFWLGSILAFVVSAVSVNLGLGLHFAGDQPEFGILWPQAGFTFAVVCLWGWPYLPALFLGMLAGLYVPGIAPIYFFGHAFSYCLGALAGAVVLGRFKGFNPALEQVRDVGQFLVGLVSASLTSSLLTSLFYVAAEAETGPAFWLDLWGRRWVSDGLGILILTPLFFTWFHHRSSPVRNRHWREVALWLLAVVGAGFLHFGNVYPGSFINYPLELLLFPVMAWGAIRYGQRASSAGIFILFQLAIWPILEVFGTNPDAIVQSTIFLSSFLGILAVTTLFLGAAVAEIRNREKASSDAEGGLRSLMDSIPDVAFLVHEDGFINEVFANQRTAFASAAMEMRHRPLRDCLPLKEAESILSKIQLCLDTGQIQKLDYAYRKDGKRWWFEGRFSRVQEPGGGQFGKTERRNVIWMAYDLTERKAQEQILERKDSLLESSARGVNALLTEPEENQAIRQVCRAIGEDLKVSRLFLYERVTDTRTGLPRLKCRYEWTQQGFPVMAAPGTLLDHDFETHLAGMMDSLRAGDLVQGFAREFEEPLEDTLRSRKAVSVAWAPVMLHGEFWGVLGMEEGREERIWEDYELRVLRMLADSFGGFLVSKHNEAELRKAKHLADEANAAKSEFLAMMSHEIRTPMNAIIGFADLMNQSQMLEDQREYLNIIQRSGDSLLELINNILDYSKIESRRIELEQSPFNLEQVICEVLEMVMVKARDKSISLDYLVSGDLPEVLLGDAHRIRQIFLNLVNNAVKFTREGEVWVKVEATPLPEGGKVRLHCRVMDSGIGIPPSKLQKLFQPFTQVDSSTTRKFGGTGLGLVISKRLSERMNGKMWVESEVNKGSTFHFTMDLPYGDGEPATQEATDGGQDMSPDFSQRNPLSLLLAEDEPVNQMLAQEVFRQLGYDISLAKDGQEALEAIRNGTYDAVYMDIHMPEMDGLEVTRKVREGEAGAEKREQYIIALTAFALEEDKKRCLDSGMNDYLSKPIQIQQIKRSLERAYEVLYDEGT